MAFQLRHLDEDTIFEHVFDRYVQIETHVGSLKQDLGILSRDEHEVEVQIEPDEELSRPKRKSRQSNRRQKNNPETSRGSIDSSVTQTFSITVNQSITSLNSSQVNNNSTTGYVLWSITPFFLKWLLYSKSAAFLRVNDGGASSVKLLNSEESISVPSIMGDNVGIIELGSGISGILPTVMGNYVATYIATDQRGILKKLKSNIKDNLLQLNRRCIVSSSLHVDQSTDSDDLNIISNRCQLEVEPIDWETFHLTDQTLSKLYPYLSKLKDQAETVYIIALDVIYNDFLIAPFLTALRQLLDYYRKSNPERSIRVRALVGIQLRSQEVVTSFLEHAVLNHNLKVYSVEDADWQHTRFNLYLIE
ncbi:S-adenosylmethionine-dependent methyltransferase KNAG_0A02920 [Huiozyma naganishii CBS 8797]|uniref:Ribosomal lysine N-methyltransferase 5 n=1 Tax=Huiozyma naganishii (strain ATCC MYA-139 / BCRC 22969 / CBS 8797 / KCTC 17520 / NBRC 10181 / NCYC 3082 / Yp74L-3) TaxID=1071383 RepID=J7S3H9_HUIN7|nr:hypothetical protein KNAG_0A02920 [Kazachstania naganishii CBS 8797]CCK67981.1 hypothetical protein KNAG_0A02920 [Kazachstania naganishii CBS 8797]